MIHVTGIRETTRTIEKATTAVTDLKTAMAAAGDTLAAAARDLAPVRTGRYRDSIRTTHTETRATIRASVPYARKIEAIHRPLDRATSARADAALRTLTDCLTAAIRATGAS